MYFVKTKKNTESRELALMIIRFLKKNKFDYCLEKDSTFSGKKKSLHEVEPSVVLSIGDDNTMLETFRLLDEREIPVLGIASSQSFLSQADATTYQNLLLLFRRGKYTILKRSRIEALCNGNEHHTALNDVGIFPAKSASLMRYTLQLNNEAFWKDTADGIIFSTPTGSTGYSYSAHGPIIVDEPAVFSISAISSLEKKPVIIVSNSTAISISNISAQQPVAIMDGDIRVPLKEDTVTIKRARYDALFVQFSKAYGLEKKLKKRTASTGVKTKSLSPSAKLVYKILAYEGSLTQKEIVVQTMLPERTVRYALELLLRKHLIQKQPHLSDARQTLYSI